MKKLIFLLSIAVFIYGQEYQITYVPVVDYSIDGYTNEIYYRHDITGDVFKTNSTGTNHSLTEFQSVPRFSNKSHSAAHILNNDLYLYDFESDTSIFLIHSNYFYFGSYLLFSPSDDKILIAVPPLANKYQPFDGNVVYYSFSDDLVHNLGITIHCDEMEWLTDTTIVFIGLGGYDINILSIHNLNITTVVPHADSVTIWGLANNQNINAFAYSWEYNTAENTLINLYYPESGLDTIVYNFIEQGPGQEDYRIFIRSLTWENKRNKLAFLGVNPLQYLSLNYVFDYNTFKTFLYSDWLTNGDGFKYNLQWLNQDTVVYSDYYDNGCLFGLDVTTPVSVEDKFTALKFELAQNYPNPFNPTTTIRYELPEKSFVTIKVYDVLGNEVVVLVNDENVAGEYAVDFDGKDLSSGIYFYTLKTGNFKETRKMILLK